MKYMEEINYYYCGIKKKNDFYKNQKIINKDI